MICIWYVYALSATLNSGVQIEKNKARVLYVYSLILRYEASVNKFKVGFAWKFQCTYITHRNFGPATLIISKFTVGIYYL